jgi:hypothetical protein
VGPAGIRECSIADAVMSVLVKKKLGAGGTASSRQSTSESLGLYNGICNFACLCDSMGVLGNKHEQRLNHDTYRRHLALVYTSVPLMSISFA